MKTGLSIEPIQYDNNKILIKTRKGLSTECVFILVNQVICCFYKGGRGQEAVYYNCPKSFKIMFFIRWLNKFEDFY